MLTHPGIDPVAISLGPVSIHWYGIMYLLAFGGAWALGRWRARKTWRGWQSADMDDFMFYAVLGVILGGRVGYVLFYDFARFVDDPVSIVRVWQGGMSFHGGLLGVIVAMWLFARKVGKTRPMTFAGVADFVAPLVPIGLCTGRIGNFINARLWGTPSDLPWAMTFPTTDPSGLARHPSQLYEALLEGLVLFLILQWFARVPRKPMAVAGLFLLGYGVFRFGVEFVRVPDAHISYLAGGWLTMGHVLTLPMILIGAFFVFRPAHRAGQDTR